MTPNFTEIIPYNNRVIDYFIPVYVYKNSHKDCFSIMQKGLVVGHTNKAILFDCRFIVRKAGYEKFKKTKVKNVHAFISGYIRHMGLPLEFKDIPVTYNPHNCPHFHRVGENQYYINYASWVKLENGSVSI